MILSNRFLPYRQQWVILVSLLILSLLLAACGDATSSPVAGVTPLPATTGQIFDTTATATSAPTKIANPTQTARPTATLQPATATPTIQNGKLTSGTVGQVFPALANNLPEQATQISITDNYVSIGPGYAASYKLNRTGNSFAGSARITSYSTKQSLDLVTTIPADVAKNFLQSLAQIPIEEGKYTPFIEHTDDYPDIRYQVETPNGMLDFYTSSQDKLDSTSPEYYNLPWGFTFANRDFTITSPLVAEALGKLRPYMYQEVIKQALNGEPLVPNVSPTQTAKLTLTPQPSTATPDIQPTNPTGTTISGTTSGTVGQIFPVLATSLPEQATQITIINNYGGLYQGYDSSYSLTRTGDSFAGSAKITSYKSQQSINLTIAIPADVAKDFLQSLAQIPIEEGRYMPLISHTDDFPDVSYKIETPYGVLNFYSRSQDPRGHTLSGYYNLPGGFTFADRNFTITSTLASQALGKLSPYMHQEVIEQALKGEPLTPAPGNQIVTPTRIP